MDDRILTHKFDYCVVGLRCLDQLLERPDPKYIGGIERQICTLARLLCRSGKSVAFISYGDSTIEQSIEGIQVFGAYVEDDGVRFVRFLHPRLSGLWGAMRRSNAEIYIQMGAGLVTGLVGLGTRALWPLRPRKFIFIAASDADTDMSFLKHRHERWFYRIGLYMTDRILTQTRRQQGLLESNMRYSSSVADLPYVSSGIKPNISSTNLTEISVIWVGRLIDIKRPAWVIDLAARCPNIHFDIVGPAVVGSELEESLKHQASTSPNVTLHGRVSEERLLELFGSAFALCCTSEVEGFPTTFLEAWYFGLPIVTTFDPDDLVASNELGFVSSTVEGLATSLQALVCDRSTHEKISKNASEFFTRRYSADACAEKLLSVLN